MKRKNFAALLIVTLGCQAGAQIYDTNGDYVQTFVGSGEPGLVDGQGQLTKFLNPSQIVADTSSNLYVWDAGNSRIRKVTANGTVTTFAGGGVDVEGWGTNVSFSFFGGFGPMLMDHSNTIWVVTGAPYFLNIGTNSYVTIQNGGPGLTNLSTSSGVCIDSSNNIYYTGGNMIYRYNPTTGISQPFAGNGTSGYVDGNGTVFPEFSGPSALACDEANNIYVWDAGNYRIRKIDQAQNITTIAGGTYADRDGYGTNAAFNYPATSQMFSDNSGNIYFCCSVCIRKMNVQTNVVTLAGTFSAGGYMNGAGSNTLFSGAASACLSGGSIFVADNGNNRIRQISLNPQPQLVSPANLQLSTYPGLQISGIVGRTYQIQVSSNLGTWDTVATVILTSSPYLWLDQTPVSGNRMYRALLMP